MTIALATMAVVPSVVLATTGATSCINNPAYTSTSGEVAPTSYGLVVGSRATIEGQPLLLCNGTTTVSGSFHWSAIEYDDYELNPDGYNIVQIGYGRCLYANNDLGYGPLCDGSLHYYWAWGSNCPGTPNNGTGGTTGVPVPWRIGGALQSPPTTRNYYVVRETIGGVSYYDGYVDGTLLHGPDALGDTIYARVAASAVCWNNLNDGTYRQMSWFGETWNPGDSMGGWNSSGVRDHLDHTSFQFSWGTGWVSPSNLGSGECDSDIEPWFYTCTIASNSHIYVDTVSR